MGLPSRNKSASGMGGEEVDSYSDLRLARRWKRRDIVYGNLGINSSRDEALKKTVLRDNGNNDAVVEVVTIDSDDQQLLEHQNEGKIRTGDALKLQSKREKMEPLTLTLRSHSGRENTENLERVLRSSLRSERLKSRKRVLSSNSQRTNNENLRTMNDVVKKVKTVIPRILRSNSRRKNHKSSSNSDYESPNIINDVVTNVQTLIPRILRSNSRRENYKSSSNGDYENPNIMNDVVTNVQTAIPKILRSNSIRENYKSSRNGDGCSSKSHSSKAANVARHQCNHGVDSNVLIEGGPDNFVWRPEGGKKVVYARSDSDSEAEKEAEGLVLADQNYQDFLKFAKNGRRLEYTPVGGEKVTYEDSESDSEVMILDSNLFSDEKPTPVVFVDLDGEECIENHSKESAFRVELMEILRRLYNVLKYEKLWQNESYKSPLQGVRVLCKRDISYPLPYHCRSHLDVYGDLASVINHSQSDKLRILNLLHGFFYWLQQNASFQNVPSQCQRLHLFSL